MPSASFRFHELNIAGVVGVGVTPRRTRAQAEIIGLSGRPRIGQTGRRSIRSIV
jgi:hypothetical protein